MWSSNPSCGFIYLPATREVTLSLYFSVLLFSMNSCGSVDSNISAVNASFLNILVRLNPIPTNSSQHFSQFICFHMFIYFIWLCGFYGWTIVWYVFAQLNIFICFCFHSFSKSLLSTHISEFIIFHLIEFKYKLLLNPYRWPMPIAFNRIINHDILFYNFTLNS